MAHRAFSARHGVRVGRRSADHGGAAGVGVRSRWRVFGGGKEGADAGAAFTMAVLQVWAHPWRV
eukprot:119773-Chlamydomonas_euryale.AAC.1